MKDIKDIDPLDVLRDYNILLTRSQAEAIKEMSANAKNINMDPRKTAGVIETGGTKVRVVGGLDSSKLKLKLKNY